MLEFDQEHVLHRRCCYQTAVLQRTSFLVPSLFPLPLQSLCSPSDPTVYFLARKSHPQAMLLQSTLNSWSDTCPFWKFFMNGVFSACSCTSLVASFMSSDRSLDMLGKSSKTDVSAVPLCWQMDLSCLGRKGEPGTAGKGAEHSQEPRMGTGEHQQPKHCPERGGLTDSIQR